MTGHLSLRGGVVCAFSNRLTLYLSYLIGAYRVFAFNYAHVTNKAGHVKLWTRVV